MKKLLLSFLLLPGLLLSGCSTSSNEPEEEPNYLSTTVRASAFFSEVGSIEQLNSVYVGRTYSVNFAPFCLSDTELMKIINGSVEKVTYYLNTPFVLALFIVLVARIASARRNRAKRKEKAEELTRIYVNTAIQRLKVSGLERRTRWLDEDSRLSGKKEDELK